MKNLRSIGMVLLLAVLVTALIAGAALGAALTVSQKSVPPTAVVKATGTGFGGSEIVDLFLDTTNLGQATTDPAGGFVKNVQIPAAAKVGKTHLVTATGRTSSQSATRAVWVRTEWYQYGNDAGHTFCSPYENVLNVSNAASLRLSWESITAPDYNSNPSVYYGPSMYGMQGGVYVAVFESDLFALHPGTGQVRWKTTNLRTRGLSPVVANGIVYVKTRTGIQAFHCTDGSPAWSAPVGGGEYVGSASFAVSGDKVFNCNHDNGKVSAYKAADGAQLWERALISPNYIFPAVSNGRVFVVSAGKLYALNPDTGATIWSVGNATTMYFQQPAAVKGVVYVGCAGNPHTLKAFKTVDGALLWSVPLDGLAQTAPAVANGVVYVNTTGGSLYALNAATGAVIWQLENFCTIENYAPSPVVANGLVFAAKSTFHAHVLNAATGAFLKDIGSLNASPIVANGMVYTAGVGTVRAYRLPPGTP